MFKIVFAWAAIAFFSSASVQAVAQNSVQQSTGADVLPSGSIPAAAVVGDGTHQDGSPGVPLWRGLMAGSDVNSVVVQLKTLSEIKEAEARLKKGRPPEIKLKYNAEGLTLFGFRFDLSLDFEANSLNKVYLNSASVCDGVPYENSLTKLFEGLLERYPQKLKVVNSDGTESKNNLAFTDGVTQVSLVLRGSMPPSGYDVASANLDASLAEAKQSYDALTKRLRASQLERTRNYALIACPASEGLMRSVSLIYSSRAQDVASQIQDRNRREEANRRDSERL